MQTIEPTISQYTLFNNTVIQIIEKGEAIAACDASIKSNQYGGYWIITNKERVSEIDQNLYDKKW